MSVLELIDNTVIKLKEGEIARRLREKERAFIDAAGVFNPDTDTAAKNSEAIKTLLKTQEPIIRAEVEQRMNYAITRLLSVAFKEEIDRSRTWLGSI